MRRGNRDPFQQSANDDTGGADDRKHVTDHSRPNAISFRIGDSEEIRFLS
jgi:hypothetical protein